jgi:hypothetical protein
MMQRVEKEMRERVGSEWTLKVIIGGVIIGRVMKWINKQVKERSARTELLTQVIRECEKRGYEGISTTL